MGWVTSRRARSILGSCLLLVTAARCTATESPAFAGDHPRLWVRKADLSALRARAVSTNTAYVGLAAFAKAAAAEMDQGLVPARDTGETDRGLYPTEAYAELFAFMSLIDPSATARAAWAKRARKLLMHVIDIAAKGPLADSPYRDPDFAIDDRSRWYGEAFALTVDWIYDSLTASDKATILKVFSRWVDENGKADITDNNHPVPTGVYNSPSLISSRKRVRWSSNNYYTAHARNIGLMALALDKADDPNGTLRAKLEEATGAWLYVIDDMMRKDCAGGVGAEGLEYSPQTFGYVAQLLLALYTAGEAVESKWGRQVLFSKQPFWKALVDIYPHRLSPATTKHAWLGQVYQPAWSGDGQTYGPVDMISVLGPLAVYDGLAGNNKRLAAIRWYQRNAAPGGAADLAYRIRKNFLGASSPIFYFLAMDAKSGATTKDPRTALPTEAYAAGMGHVYARTGWDTKAAWFRYTLPWATVDHQQGSGNHFGYYRKGEWLTKERTGWGLENAGSDHHNTIAIENDKPLHGSSGYRRDLWLRGSQWVYVGDGDEKILARSLTKRYVYVHGDATSMYNSRGENSRDVRDASRAILWIKPDHILIYDRAETSKAGRFKRFWLHSQAKASISGRRATLTSPRGQHLYVNTLLPKSFTSGSTLTGGDPADGEPMKYRLKVEASGDPAKVRFLHALQGADKGVAAQTAKLIASTASGSRFHGVEIGRYAVLFSYDRAPAKVRSLDYEVSSTALEHFITGLAPNAGYTVSGVRSGSGLRVSVTAGGKTKADSGGVLVWRYGATGPTDGGASDGRADLGSPAGDGGAADAAAPADGAAGDAPEAIILFEASAAPADAGAAGRSGFAGGGLAGSVCSYPADAGAAPSGGLPLALLLALLLVRRRRRS